MNSDEIKWVMVIDASLPTGLIANTAAIMGISLGKMFPESVGTDVFDQAGGCHPGIIEFPVPILKGNSDMIKDIKTKLSLPAFEEVVMVDFTDTAQSCKTYEEFTEKMKQTDELHMHYMGIALCGSKKNINKLTGSMALLR